MTKRTLIKDTMNLEKRLRKLEVKDECFTCLSTSYMFRMVFLCKIRIIQVCVNYLSKFSLCSFNYCTNQTGYSISASYSVCILDKYVNKLLVLSQPDQRKRMSRRDVSIQYRLYEAKSLAAILCESWPSSINSGFK